VGAHCAVRERVLTTHTEITTMTTITTSPAFTTAAELADRITAWADTLTDTPKQHFTWGRDGWDTP
jgi:hypothetical protein